ncbi:STAM-binding protein A [Fasciolopsis buskii]|uniref:STAM-binding protein A n=1 Tax=Fasciolopsis buskii TaxID=27845 RepID=A0A8E0S1V6_9TREM|nr:STAM-binding protein A [Fasciolopsis buski]
MDPISAHTSPSQTPEDRLRYLTGCAADVELSPGLSIDQYLRAIRSMLQMVDVHIHANRQESALVLASRFLVLFLQVLPKHKDFRKISAEEMTAWKERCRTTFKKAEVLKQALRERFAAEHEEYIRQKQEEQIRQLAESDIDQLLPEPPPSPPPISTKPVGPIDACSPATFPITYPRLPEINGPSTFSSDSNLPAQPPQVDRSLKPQTNSAPHGWLPIRMSFELARRFMRLAEPNTIANRETCASLCGNLVSNEYRITDVVITKQTGTPDSCTTHNEEELFDYMEKRNLIVLGWIHTHPSQTAFLSSVDQHTQLSYQIMLPEAIAIVCAPKFNEITAFSLNPVYGLPYVRQCRESGFHPHPKSIQIYEPSPHVIDDPSALFNVVDLR